MVRSETKQPHRRRLLIVLPILVGVMCCSFCLLGVGAGAFNVTGRYGIRVDILPVPVTLIDEIKLDTPAELTLLKFGVENSLNLNVAFCDLLFMLDGSINIAGLERVILEMDVPLGPFTIHPEMWFAVPFETVTDVNHFTNWVVIPPGDILFVKTRWTFETTFEGIHFEDLLMLEDVNFPNPSTDFEPLFYPVQSQSFRVGNILTMTAEPCPGITLKSVTTYCADSGTNRVKDHSASGRVLAECELCDCSHFSETISLHGLEYCGIPYWVSLKIDPRLDPVMQLMGGGSFVLFDYYEITGSFSFFPLSLGGLYLHLSNDCLSATFQVADDFAFTGASLDFSADLEKSWGRMTFQGAGTISAQGSLTAFSINSTLSSGTVSASSGVSFSEQQNRYRLSAIRSALSMTMSPLQFSAAIVFGRTGLTQATLSAGVVF